jgi:hypothetical protein
MAPRYAADGQYAFSKYGVRAAYPSCLVSMRYTLHGGLVVLVASMAVALVFLVTFTCLAPRSC